MKKIIAILLTVIMAFGLAACNDGSSIEGADTKKESSSGGSSDGKYSIGVAFQDITNPLFAGVSENMQAMGKEKGWDVTVLDCQGNASTQISQVENYIEKAVDVLIIYPADVTALASICQQASDAGIKVISWDENMECADMAYLVENYAVGQAIGEETAKWVNENYPEGCEVAVIDYATLPVIVERANGIVDAIKEKAPNAEIVAQDSALNAAEGMTLAENMLQAHKDIKAFACIGDGSGVGVNEALKAAGVNLDEYGVFCCDATEEACTAISKGEAIRMSINLGTAKEMAEKAFECAETLMTSDSYEKEVYKTITPVTADNVGDYYSK
ncbi:sugar ABC transporter substrate-binding protein [Blautia producta]|uniref:sugar ABC transporter substrate-binding protein n=1 Tax=Blautia producta TaxID=33035 RepID=UPI0031B577D9